MTRRRALMLLATAGGAPLVAAPLHAQDQAPNRRALVITAEDQRFTPARIEVVRDELVRITLRGTAQTHSFNVDQYRIAKRIPANGSVIVEFRADRVGTFPFYCGLTADPGHDRKRGELIVREP
jgi:heme/copper-type cytochrome/quinol oxidase subunit 2